MKLRLTDMAIKKLPHPTDGQVTHWDELTPGFGLRCSKKSKSFVVMYGERRQLKTLGRYPHLSLSEARSAARKFFVEWGLCCTNRDGDSLHESSVIAGVHEQLVPDEVPDKKLVFIQCRAEATRIFVDLV